MKLSEIRELIRDGKAVDVSMAKPEELGELIEKQDCDNFIFSGVNGCGQTNGCIFTSYKTGTLYAVAGRTPALFYLYQ